MPNSVMQDREGPDWVLGSIANVTPGTPVSIMSLVDPSNLNSPNTPTPATASVAEFSPRVQQIFFGGFKPNAGNGLVANTGNIYVVRKGVGAGTGNRADYGAIVLTVLPGTTAVLASAAVDGSQFSPYRYFIDADNAGDCAQVTAIIA